MFVTLQAVTLSKNTSLPSASWRHHVMVTFVMFYYGDGVTTVVGLMSFGDYWLRHVVTITYVWR